MGWRDDPVVLLGGPLWTSDERRGGRVAPTSPVPPAARRARSGDVGGVIGLAARLFDGEGCGESAGGIGGRETGVVEGAGTGANVDERLLTSFRGVSGGGGRVCSTERPAGGTKPAPYDDMGERRVDWEDSLCTACGVGRAGSFEADALARRGETVTSSGVAAGANRRGVTWTGESRTVTGSLARALDWMSSLCSLSDTPGVVALPSPPEPLDSCRVKSVTGEPVVFVSASEVAERAVAEANGVP